MKKAWDSSASSGAVSSSNAGASELQETLKQMGSALFDKIRFSSLLCTVCRMLQTSMDNPQSDLAFLHWFIETVEPVIQ
jgi:hypothetical protein